MTFISKQVAKLRIVQ